MSETPQRPAIPTDMKAFNRRLVEEFRANHGELGGQLKGSRVILLTTTGVRTGEPRTVVVGYRTHGEDLVAIASNNGAAEHPLWYRNLLADPRATVELGSEKFAVKARTAEAHERPELAEALDYLERQQKVTKREIPIVVFERVA
jgi:deazaflavin-dependent oxidoreductase (nitroreductase family)